MRVLQVKQSGIYIFDCPGCGSHHAIHTIKPNDSNAMWKFNGDVDKPTFQPSINYGPGYCHFFIRDGRIEFCGDSKHKLAGQTVDLPELTEEWIKDWEVFWGK